MLREIGCIGGRNEKDDGKVAVHSIDTCLSMRFHMEQRYGKSIAKGSNTLLDSWQKMRDRQDNQRLRRASTKVGTMRCNPRISTSHDLCDDIMMHSFGVNRYISRCP